MSGDYDYVIVGAGSAGCVLAARLSEDPAVRVLVIEAGGWDRDPMIRLPLGFGKLHGGRRHDWGYVSEPDPALGGRSTPVKRGRVVGGSSSTNAMNFVRGHASDYDRWAAHGAHGWSFAEVLPYFKRLETFDEGGGGGGDAWRGGAGPLHVTRSGWREPLNDALFAAAEAAGYPRTDDYNAAVQEGFSAQQLTLWRGRRQSAAAAWLAPAIKRRNLTIVTGAQSERILFDRTRAVGVAYRTAAGPAEARARREVIVSGGAIGSPQVLMLSGVGDPQHLASHNIATQVALPGVGANLQDHPSAGVRYARRTPGPFHALMRYDRLAPAIARALLLGTGPAAHLPGGVAAFVRSDQRQAVPDLQFLYSPTSFEAAPWWRRDRSFADAFSMRAVLLRPETRGRVLLRDANAASSPRIELRALEHRWERDTLRRGVRMLLDLLERPELAAFRGPRLAPAGATDDAALDAHIQATAFALDHPASTCAIGSVVDAELRVIGAQGLRVVDASVMPDLVGGNINACVLMIAERAADLIRGRAPLPAERPEPQTAA